MLKLLGEVTRVDLKLPSSCVLSTWYIRKVLPKDREGRGGPVTCTGQNRLSLPYWEASTAVVGVQDLLPLLTMKVVKQPAFVVPAALMMTTTLQFLGLKDDHDMLLC